VHPEKVICQKLLQVTSIEEDKLKFCTLFLPATFLATFLHFSHKFQNQQKILRSIFKNFAKKEILGHINIFLKR
jgi:hypothetical protein